MQILTQHKVITGILPRGTSIDVLKKLKTEKGIITAFVNTARGMGKLMPGVHRGLGEQTEKEILEVIVDAGRADEIFAYLYEIAEIDRPHGGIIFMARVSQITPYVLPAIPEEK
jgi:nitrogen regulatory protein PII